MPSPRLVASLLALFAVVAAGGAAPAFAGDWTVGEITGPPGTTNIAPSAVNADGVVVGQARFPGRTIETAFRWEDGVMTELAIPAGMPLTVALDINDAGTIVGYAGAEQPCCTSQISTNGAMWTATKDSSSVSLTPYNTYGAFTTSGAHKDHGSVLWGINNGGTVVGSASFEWFSPYNNPRNEPTYTTFPTVGAFSRLPLPDTLNAQTGGTVYGGQAKQVNDHGDIMGEAGPGAVRVWPGGGGGTGTTYDVYPGRHGLNDEGHIAGRTDVLSGSGTEQDFRALLWNGKEHVRIGAAQPQSVANAVNDSDWAVGRAGVFWIVLPRTAGNAFLWRPDEAPTPLYALAPSGWSMANATDINDDGMIVGSGKHGGKEMGFWMAPASIAHRLSGTVRDPAGAPVAGARLRVTNAAGNELATPVTGADGRYSTTLSRGGPYDVTVLPDGAYRPDGLAGCTIVGAACRLNLGKNRTVDFYGIDVAVPPADPRTGGGGGGAAGGGGGGAGPAGASASSPAKGPAFAIPAKNKSLTAGAGGVVGFALGPFSSAATGTISLQTAGKVAAASAKATVLTLGKATFTAKKGKALTVKVKLAKKGRAYLSRKRTVKAVAVITARTAAGGATTKRYTLTIKAPRR